MNSELHDCAKSGNLERIRQLVEGGANIEETNNDGMTALLLASLKGHFEIIVYLVERGANFAHTDNTGMTALQFASGGGHLSSVKYLLKHGAGARRAMTASMSLMMANMSTLTTGTSDMEI
jgi:ankyrin repeat protein